MLTLTTLGIASSSLIVPSLQATTKNPKSDSSFQQMEGWNAYTMSASRHLSKLNPNHPVHFQSKGKDAPYEMSIEKFRSGQQAQHKVNESAPDDTDLQLYGQALQETILGTAILTVVGAITLFGLRSKIQEDNAHHLLCDLHRRELRVLYLGLLVTEGLMILCVGFGVGFSIWKALWEAKGRFRTARDWSHEVLAVLLPFYLGALVGTVTLVVMGLGRLTSRGVECTC